MKLQFQSMASRSSKVRVEKIHISLVMYRSRIIGINRGNKIFHRYPLLTSSLSLDFRF